jgi:hypothetical protein
MKTERHGGSRGDPSGRQQRGDRLASLQKLSATEDRVAIRVGAKGKFLPLILLEDLAQFIR